MKLLFQKLFNKIKHNKFITDDEIEMLCWEYVDENYHKLITQEDVLNTNNMWRKVNLWVKVRSDDARL